MAKKTKKTAISGYVCQSREETQDAIHELGNAQRELIRLETRMNDEIAAINTREKGHIEALRHRMERLVGGIQIWCEANRAELLKDGGKTANLVTGQVSWRLCPSTVSIRGAEEVIAKLKELQLTQYLRVKEEINKEAISANPAPVLGIKGVSLRSGKEEFSIEPFEVEVSA